MKQTELDEFDIKILEIVQRNSRLSTEAIAEEVHLSPSAVQRRLKRLRKEGVIEAEVAVISPQAVGQRLITIVEITMENEQPSTLNGFKQLMLDAPEVMQCYYVTGATDFVIIMTTEDMQEYDAFAQKFFLGNNSVKRFNTTVVIQKVKSTLTVPLKFK